MSSVMNKVKHRSEDGKVEYYILDLDAGGYPRSNSVDLQSLLRQELLKSQDPPYTDVVMMSHGWNTNRNSDGSIPLANRVFRQMEESKPTDRKVLYVAVKWPSFVTTVFEPSSEDDPKAVVSDVMKKLRQTVAEGEDTAADPTMAFGMAQDNVSATPVSLTAASECETACTSFVDPAVKTEEKDPESLPEDVCVTVAKLVNEIGKQSGRVNADDSSPLDDGEKYGAVTPETVLNKYKNMRGKNLTPSAPVAEPVIASRSFPVISGAVEAGKKKAWDLANTIFDVVFGTFERRAAIVGSRGVHWTLADMMEHASPNTKFHLFGHSLGAHVVQSASIGRLPGSKLSRKIHTMFLGQGACPSQVYARGGAYRPIASSLKPIAGPIIASIYESDAALMLYDAFLPRPVGRFGVEQCDPLPSENITLQQRVDRGPAQKFTLKPQTVYNVQGGPVISGHGDIADPEVMNLFWQAASVELEKKEVEVVESSELPRGFWKDYNIRSEKPSGWGLGGDCALM